MFGETAYDLKFHLLGYPVRVSPWFWAIALGLAWRPNSDITELLIFVACIFISILLHEFGHGLTATAFRCEPREILLYTLGGLCYFVPPRNLRRWQSILITAAGPGVNFALTGISYAILEFSGLDFPPRLEISLVIILWINLVWGIINLLPVLPLDGGRIAEDLLGFIHPGAARLRAHFLSIATCGIILAAMISWGYTASLWNLLMPGLLMFWNIQGYQAERARWSSAWPDDNDRWKY